MNETVRITMYNFYKRGIITQREWNTWCNRWMHNVFFTNPQVVEILVRMKQN